MGNSELNGFGDEPLNFRSKDYEALWSKPNQTDYSVLCTFAHILEDSSISYNIVEKTLVQLQLTLVDYPAEYMLQKPNLLVKILLLWNHANNLQYNVTNILETLIIYIGCLQKRIETQRQWNTNELLCHSQMLHDDERQLRLDIILPILLKKAVNQLQYDFENNFEHEMQFKVFKFIFKLQNVLETQKIIVRGEHLEKLEWLCAQIRKFVEQNINESTNEEIFMQLRLQYILATFLFQRFIMSNNNEEDRLSISKHIDLLDTLLVDFPLRVFYPEQMKLFEEYLCKNSKGMPFKKILKYFDKYEENYTAIINLLKQVTTNSAELAIKPADIIKKCNNKVNYISKLQSPKLINIIMNAIKIVLPQMLTNATLKKQAIELLLDMFRIPVENLRMCVYQAASQYVKFFFTSLINGERFCGTSSNAQFLKELLTGIPMTTEILLQIIDECSDCENLQIKEYCLDILVVPLRAHHLFDEFWKFYLNILLPILPLLHGCTSTVEDLLTNQLLKLSNPDAGYLPIYAVIQNNCCFLFHPNANVRSEALARITYMLTSMDANAAYQQNTFELSNNISSDIFVELQELEIYEIFTLTEGIFNFNEERASLEQLLDILQNTTFDVVLQKTALLQINIKLRHWQMLGYFYERNGPFSVLKVLENSLKQASIDSTVSMSAVGIIAKMLFYDELLRQELAQTNNIYIILLRTLYLYHFDKDVRQNVGICLYLLIFKKFVQIFPPTLTSNLHVKLPKVLNSLWRPFKFEPVRIFQNLHTNQRQEQNNDDVPLFRNINEERKLLRCLIAATCCGDITEVTRDYINHQQRSNCATQDIDSTLHLKKIDCSLIMATNPKCNLQKLLQTAQNATAHETILKIANIFEYQLLLLTFTTPQKVAVPNALKQQLVGFLDKFLKILPKTSINLLLYERVIELAYQCLELNELDISSAIFYMLCKDFKHTLFVMLKEHQNTNRLFRKMCLFLAHVLKVSCNLQNNNLKEEIQMKHYFFDTFIVMLHEFFEQRNFQRVRCLLFVLRELIDLKLTLSDEILYEKCKEFFKFCFCLKSATFTGAQMLRDCLYIICQLRQQMNMPQSIFKPKSSIIRNLVELCKHQCAEVRALVWCHLMHFIHYQVPRDTGSNNSQQNSKEPKFLPDGFAGMCLNRMLDSGESVIVREFAGNVFIELIATNCVDFEFTLGLLEEYKLFPRILELLDKECQINCHNVFESNLNLTSFHCELFSCVARICQLLVRMRADYVEQLCEEKFMCKFYNVLKVKSIDTKNHKSHIKMCADLCQLYALCTSKNRNFGQQTFCHDRVFLNHYFQLFSPEKCALENRHLMKIIQLLLVLCNDEVAYEVLCLEFKNEPKYILSVINQALCVSKIKSHFQNITLAVLSMLLVKSQLHLKQITFKDILELPIPKNESDNNDEGNLYYPSVTICRDLFQLFTKLYPEHFEKFENSPNKSQIKIAQCFGLLLKFCDHAAQYADSVKVLDYVLHILQIFLAEYNCCNKNFARRYEEKRRLIIIQYLIILVEFLLNWFSAPSAVLSDEMYANRLTRILVDLWSFLAYSEDLKLTVLQLCAVLSERSLAVARKFSVTYPANKDCLIQLVSKISKTETDRIKAQSYNHIPIIIISLRVIINSCSSLEGRLCVSKLSLLDTIDNLYPFNMKATKVKHEILQNWLQFWELFSRYSEGSKPVYLSSICRVINFLRPNNEIRVLLLKILRNMCFQSNNRASLISSDDFIHTAYEVISVPLETVNMFQEKIIIITSIWKLISGGVKFVSIIRGTKLAKKICNFCEQFYNIPTSCYDAQGDDFKNIIFIIYDILKD